MKYLLVTLCLIWYILTMEQQSKLHVRLPLEMQKRLKAVAALEGLTIMEAVRQAIELWLSARLK